MPIKWQGKEGRREGRGKKNLTIPSVNENTEQLEFSCIKARNAKWYSDLENDLLFLMKLNVP